MFVASAIAYACHRIQRGTVWHADLIDAGFVVLEVIFFMTSRDTLRKYYQRTKQLLAPPMTSRSEPGEQTSAIAETKVSRDE